MDRDCEIGVMGDLLLFTKYITSFTRLMLTLSIEFRLLAVNTESIGSAYRTNISLLLSQIIHRMIKGGTRFETDLIDIAIFIFLERGASVSLIFPYNKGETYLI